MWAGPTQKNKKIQVRATCRLLLALQARLMQLGAAWSSPGLTPAAGAAGPPGESVVWGDPLVCSHH